MLNYVWIGLILIGILVAVGTDVASEINNTYQNGTQFEAVIEGASLDAARTADTKAELIVDRGYAARFYNLPEAKGEARIPVVLSRKASGDLSLSMTTAENLPGRWALMSQNTNEKDKLTAVVAGTTPIDGSSKVKVQLVFEHIQYVKLKAVTKAALDFAAMAVQIALGLIGVMALWLGVMRVAELAGVIALLTKLVSPITRRLFPEIPHDHPAIGSMVMNIAANVLGLSNAATPLGLKAMEELNKLNPKPGTATNAMCTFLVINTGGVILVPATVIAIRAAAGSVNPGIIIATSLVGSGCATVCGVIAAKIMQRMPMFNKAKEE